MYTYTKITIRTFAIDVARFPFDIAFKFILFNAKFILLNSLKHFSLAIRILYVYFQKKNIFPAFFLLSN